MSIGRALIVDDSKVVQFKLKRMLESRGLGVDTASSGHEALDFLKAHAPDVIFMDFMMPDMDGYEVTGMITADPHTAAIPVVMCTGHDTPQDRARAKENGASAFVTKPVDDTALDSLLAELNGRVVSHPAAHPVAAEAEIAVAADARCRGGNDRQPANIEPGSGHRREPGGERA